MSAGTDRRTADRLPTFLGIGALKAGTSYLDALLRTHPEITMPASMKEVQFFTAHHERGPEWYAAQYPATSTEVRGDVSPEYLADPRCPARIAALLPDVKLVLSVRSPVQRAYSQYRHWVQETGYRGSFAQFLVDHPAGIDRGLYWTHLQRYLAHVPAERIHVLVFEELVRRPETVLPSLFGFLGVREDHAPANLGEAENVSGTRRFPALYVQAKRLSRRLYGSGHGRWVTAVKRGPLGRVFQDPARASSAPPIEPATAAELMERYADEIAGLSRFVGRDLAGLWSAPTPPAERTQHTAHQQEDV